MPTMDELAQITGRGVAEVLDPTIAILAPILRKNQAAIKEIPLRTFQYGPTDRHQLDVYYPLNPHKSGKTPVLFFVYGGSFTSGERNLSVKFGLVYACLGAFFARQGIVTVIPDYRLVPNVTYPGPVEDVRDAMSWVVQNVDEVLTSNAVPRSSLLLDKLFILGHSAGAFHTGTLVFNPDVLPFDSDLRARIAGAAMFGGPYDLAAVEAGTERGKIYEQYFGGVDEAKKKDILALVRNYPDGEVGRLPDLVLLKAEQEPDFLHEASDGLKKEIERRRNDEQRIIVAKGHNHISVNWVLGTGEGEEWAYELAEWITSRAGV
ncbi:alpha/beta hydrolase domain-containing protein [Ephemerocybe angulata]|uniref:Alpha/beta hydrolase domain-containing protein n=1 Tax=Ephemerocybe angulata TaxID=980116 RepID=A0A8H6I0Z6_9AGAR|nr:alpha/beta hydrolase domain-containing protein [Tulosesus angulatus]